MTWENFVFVTYASMGVWHAAVAKGLRLSSYVFKGSSVCSQVPPLPMTSKICNGSVTPLNT